MSTFKGTPGPWKMNGLSQSGKVNFNVIGTRLGGRYKIARVAFNQLSKDDGEGFEKYNARELSEAEANANLIAAAPELLEALVNCVTELESVALAHFKENSISDELAKDFLSKVDVLNKAKAAIAKATGKNE